MFETCPGVYGLVVKGLSCVEQFRVRVIDQVALHHDLAELELRASRAPRP